MISGFSNERVNYRTRYLQFPSTLTESVPSISKPTVHVIKIRFNNIFKNDKILFAVISVALSLASLVVGYGLYSMYNNVISNEEVIEGQNIVAMDELNAISAEDAGISVMNKAGLSGGTAGSAQGGNYLAFNNGGGIDPNSMLLASGESKATGKEALTSKKAVVDVDEKVVLNPFLPANEAVVKKVVKVKPNPNYVMPPTTLNSSPDANTLLKTSVSGIMYDVYSPSAIIKISGTDYFVKKGDVIQGFKIIGINQKSVVIKKGNNIYDARIGIILATIKPNTTGTANINRKFGGSPSTRNVSYRR